MYASELVRYERIVFTFGCFRKQNVRIEVYGGPMTRYVIGPDVAVQLARDRAVISGEHRLLAPTLLRSQVLSNLYQAVRRDEMTSKDAERQLDYLRTLRIRLLGDRVLQRVAWKVADELGWPDTLDAEYVALTQLQAEAFVTLDAKLARAVTEVVPIAPIQALS
jgi:predicted nucleic acid-binding protein